MDIQYLIFYMISGKRCPLPDMAEQTPAVKGKYKQNAKKKCTLCKDYKSHKPQKRIHDVPFLSQIRSDTGIPFRLRSFAENISSACGADFFS